MKVALIGHYWTGLRSRFEAALSPRHELLFFGTARDPGLDEHLESVEVLVSSAFPAPLGRRARALRLVHSSGAGVEKIDLSAVAAGVPLCCTYNHGSSIAEYVVMVILALHRELFRQDRELRSGRWLNVGSDPGVALHSTLEGHSVLILGTGEIGSAVAARCAPFGMRPLGVNRGGRRPEGSAFEEVAALPELDALLPRADFTVLALPLTGETRGILDARRLRLMKPGAHLINVGRGPLVDEAALFEALESRRIAGAGLDVWYGYPQGPGDPTPPSAFPFHRLDNVIMTPHSSGNTITTFTRRADDIIDNVRRLERGEPLRNLVGRGELAG